MEEPSRTLVELSCNISRACRINFVSTASHDDRCKCSCLSVAVAKIHLFLDNKIISELVKCSKQYFVSLSIYSDMSPINRFFLSECLRILSSKSLCQLFCNLLEYVLQIIM